MTRQAWLIYAMGGGWGHLNRALALGRQAALHHTVHILTNSPYVAHLPPLPPHLQLQTIPAEWRLPQACDRVRQLVQTLPVQRLIIDTFPRGIGGELLPLLPTIPCPRILIHRDINPQYVEQKHLRGFVQRQYHRILIPGEGPDVAFADLPQARHTAPWLSRNAAELPNRATARAQLRLPPKRNQPVVVVLAGGRVEELAWFGQVTVAIAQTFPHMAVRCLAATCPPDCPPALWVTHYPALECLVAADLVVGSGGYNTVQECLTLGLPLMARPFPRLYDRQHHRLLRHQQAGKPIQICHQLTNVLAAIARWLPQWQPHAPGHLTYANGAIAAYTEIAQLHQQAIASIFMLS